MLGMGGNHYWVATITYKMSQVEQSESDDLFFLKFSEWRESQEVMIVGIIFAFPMPMEKLKMMTSSPLVS